MKQNNKTEKTVQKRLRRPKQMIKGYGLDWMYNKGQDMTEMAKDIDNHSLLAILPKWQR